MTAPYPLSNSRLDPTISLGLRRLCILLVVLGIGLRFVNLAPKHKPVWLDETFTAFHISGFSDQAVKDRLFAAQQPIAVGDLIPFQHPQGNIQGTIEHIALTAPELPPPYFIGGAWAMSIFGKSALVLRIYSALLSLLMLPAMYWFCQELFANSTVSWLGAALVALSPVHLLYAQEARPYGLWGTLLLLSHATLLHALRRRTIGSWLAYGAALVGGLYCHLLFGLIAVAQAVYMAVREWPSLKKRRLGPVLPGYLAAAFGALLLFVPWMVYALTNFTNFEAAAEYRDKVPWGPHLFVLLRAWLRTLSLMFADFNVASGVDSPGWQLALAGILSVFWAGAIVLLGRNFYHQADRSTRQYLTITLLVPIAVMVLPDLLFASSRSMATRYFLPTMLSLQAIMAYSLLHGQFLRPSRRRQGVLALILAFNLASCFYFCALPTWWSKADAQALPTLSRAIEQHPEAIVLSDEAWVKSFALTHSLPPETRLWWLKTPGLPPNLPQDSRLYLFAPTKPLLKSVADRYQARKMAVSLWELTPR
jgi:uncharacterized membrane protein